MSTTRGKTVTDVNNEATVVRGHVVSGQRPLPRVIVRVFACTLREQHQVGEAVTDRHGEYVVQCQIRQPHGDGKGGAALIVRAYGGGESPLAESRRYFDTNSDLYVPLTTDGNVGAKDEYELTATTVEPLLGDVAPEKLGDDEKHDDISFLVEETGLEREALAAFAAANRIAAQTQLPVDALYGAIRVGLSDSLPGLAGEAPEVQRAALESAVARKLVPAQVAERIDEIVERLQQLRVAAALKPGEDGEASLGDLLTYGSPGGDAARRAAEVYLERGGPDEGFWAVLGEDASFAAEGSLDGLRSAFGLAQLTSNNLPLLRAVDEERKSLDSPSFRFLAALDEQDWVERIDAADEHVPADVRGSTADVRKRRYAARLRDAAEAAFPTQAIASRLTRADVPHAAEIAGFLAASPDFEFGRTPVPLYLARNGQAFAAADDPDAAGASLAAMDRLFRLTPRYAHIQPLLDAGLDSAHSIALMGRDRFVADHAKRFGGKAFALDVYNRAANAAAESVAIYAILSPLVNNMPLAVAPVPASELAARPEWATLFGTLDMCACEHCRSVLSPAAYLVDLLHLLADHPKPSPKKTASKKTKLKKPVKKAPLDVLRARRPDLVEIELSCPNTNTALPYIDLVNEILENAVSPAGGGKELWQSRKKADQLAIEPEHTNDEAYVVLATQPYPWTLPFDLPLERVRRFLKHAGVQRHEIMAVYRNRPIPPDVAVPDPIDVVIAAERLGLTPFERRLVTGLAGAPISALWGGATIGALRAVPEFLRRSGLEFAELLELLDTDFIDPADAFHVVPRASCALGEMTIEHLDDDSSMLERSHRFIRLWRALGWASLRDLDRAVAALRPKGLNEGFLVSLSQVEVLRAELDVPLLEMLAWWGKIDVAVYDAPGTPHAPSLFDQLFQNAALVTPLDPAFGPLKTSETIDKHSATVLAGLRLSVDDLALLLDKKAAAHWLELPKSEVAGHLLTLENLSALHRVASLARALDLSITDLLAAKAMSGIDPFGGPGSTRGFVAAVRRILTSPFSIEELDWLIRHAHRPDSSVEPAPVDIDRVLIDLATALDAIRADTAPPPDPTGALPVLDPTGELTRRMLAVVLTPDQLEPVMAMIADLAPPAGDLFDARKALIETSEMSAFLVDPSAATARLLAPEPKPAEGTTAPTEGERRSTRFAYVLERLLPHVRRRRSEELIAKSIGEALGLDAETIRPLLKNLVAAPISGAPSSMEALLSVDMLSLDPKNKANRIVDWRRLYVRLAKVATVLTRYGMTPAEATWIIEHGPARGWLDLATLPLTTDSTVESLKTRFKAFARLDDLFRLFAAQPVLRRVPPGKLPAEIPLFQLFLRADKNIMGGSDAAAKLRGDLGTLTGWRNLETDMPQLTPVCDLGIVTSYRDEAALLRLDAALRISERLRLPPAVLQKICKEYIDPTPDPTLDGPLPTVVMQAVRSADGGRPPSVIRPVVDALRERQRDALVSYLLFKQKRQSTNELFDEYLIDVEMSPCQLTSRIKQAIGTVQLFVQRALTGFEPAATIDPEWARRWWWMRNYRVWEANRKVFLYPENWIEPELRDDKTPQFEELESTLLQDEITPEHVEDAFRTYLAQLDEVARLEVRAVSEEQREGVHIVHVVARTRGLPHRYFYRRREATRWTAWEQVDADIEGDHLLLVVYEHRLQLLWPIFEETAYEPSDWSSADAPKESKRYWEISLARSVLENGVWSPSTTSKSALRFEEQSWTNRRNDRYVPPTDHAFMPVSGSILKIRWFMRDLEPSLDIWDWWEVGAFRLDSCHGELTAEMLPSEDRKQAPIPIPKWTSIQGEVLVEQPPASADADAADAGALYLMPLTAPEGAWKISPKILGSTPGRSAFELVGPHQDTFFNPEKSFYFQDATRTYFISPGCPPTPFLGK